MAGPKKSSNTSCKQSSKKNFTYTSNLFVFIKILIRKEEVRYILLKKNVPTNIKHFRIFVGILLSLF